MSLNATDIERWLNLGSPDAEIERAMLRDIIKAYPEIEVPINSRFHQACNGLISVSGPQSPIEEWLETICQKYYNSQSLGSVEGFKIGEHVRCINNGSKFAQILRFSVHLDYAFVHFQGYSSEYDAWVPLHWLKKN